MTFIEVNEDLREEVVAFRGDIIVSRGHIHEIKKLDGFVYLKHER
jgi:hypothetical protein